MKQGATIFFSIIFFLINGFAYSQTNDSKNTTDIQISPSGNLTHSENSVFINPNNPNQILNSNNYSAIPHFTNVNYGVSAQPSTDGGQTWPVPPGIIGNLNSSTTDPAVAIGLNGKMYIEYVENINSDINISISSDNGQTWQENVVAYNPGFGQGLVFDKNHLWIDNRNFKQDNSSNNRKGYLYTGWTDFSGGYPYNGREILVSVSTDDGNTWCTQFTQPGISSTLVFPPVLQNQGVNIQTGPNGEVYAVWALIDVVGFFGNIPHERSIGFSKLLPGTNGCAQSDWTNAVEIKNINSTRDASLFCGNMRHSSFPSMTVNQQNGNIYIVWTEQVAPGDEDIYMIRSTDDGATWNSGFPVRVNQTTIHDQFMPWIACDEISGALVTIYYSSQNAPSNIGHPPCVETFVAISTDDGNTWNDYRISGTVGNGQAWDADLITGFTQPYAGDYLGIDVAHGRVVPVWSDKRGGMKAFTQPFDVPCPQNLNLIYDDYYITDEPNFSFDAAYSAVSSIYVKGSGINNSYKIYNGASVLMTAGDEVVLDDGFVSEGEFYAYTTPCSTFSQRTTPIQPTKELSPPVAEATSKPLLETNKPANNFPVGIYPNPSAGKFVLAKTNQDEISSSEIFIYNSLGQVVFKSLILNSNSQIDISSHPKGIYFLKVQNGEKIYTEKVVVQ